MSILNRTAKIMASLSVLLLIVALIWLHVGTFKQPEIFNAIEFVDEIQMSFNAENGDVFYIYSEHGAYTLTSANAKWEIVNRRPMYECLKIMSRLSQEHPIEDEKVWDAYIRIIASDSTNWGM